MKKANIVNNLQELFNSPFSQYCVTADCTAKDLRGAKIAFLVWSLDISGGTNVILNHCDFLTRLGAEVTVVRFYKQDVLDWHHALKQIRIVYIDDLANNSQFDIAIATWWRTAFQLDRVKATSYAYFVQSVESRFYLNSAPEYSPVVDMTYNLGVPMITISTWIQAYLAFAHGRPSFLVKNGLDKAIFNPLGPRVAGQQARSKPRFLVEGPLAVDFKQTELAIDSLQPFRDLVEVWLLTSSDVTEVAGVDRVFSRVPISEVAPIMRSCDALIKLSLVEGMFGPPLEMFHCGGTAVAARVTGCEEYMVDGYNCVLVDDSGDRQQIETALKKIIDDPEKLNRLKKGALDTAALWPDWDRSSLSFATTLNIIMNNSDNIFMSRFVKAKAELLSLEG